MNSTFTEEPSTLVITCSSGVSPYLAREVKELGFYIGRTTDSTVETEGTLADCVKLNLHLRTAHRVLYTLDRFRARNANNLYNSLVEIPWENYIDPAGYFSVDKAVDNPTITDTRYASLKVKDAVVDRIRNKFGCRPDSGNERDRTCLFVHWMGDNASIYIDTTGESLSFRGYRASTSEAPMRESLAAAVVMASGWNKRGTFVNPMCGCGTIAIEAAWMAQNRAPAMLRDNFAFMHLCCYEPSVWTKVVSDAMKAYEASKNISCGIVATDIDCAMVDATFENAEFAGIDKLIQCEVCDFMLTSVPETAERGTIIMNPPYGGRMGDPLRLRDTYTGMGVFLQKHKASYDGFIFTGNPELAENSGLESGHPQTFYSGRIECSLLENPTLKPEDEARFLRRSAVR